MNTEARHIAPSPAVALLADLGARGVMVWLDGDRVRWKAPTGAVSVALLKAIKAQEADLAALLTDNRHPLVRPQEVS